VTGKGRGPATSIPASGAGMARTILKNPESPPIVIGSEARDLTTERPLLFGLDYNYGTY